jgi:hypothetical protein
MNCADIERLVQQRLDGAPVDVPAADSHLGGCPACRQLWSACQRLEDGLRSIAPPVVPAGLRDRVVAGYLQDRQDAQRLARRRLVIGITSLAASTLFVAFLLKPWAPPVDRPDEPAPLVKTDEPKTAPRAGNVQDSVGEAGQALVAIVTRTAGDTVGSGRLLMPDAVAIATPMTEAWGETLVPPAEPVRDVSRGVSTAVAPVTNSARRAVNLFWRDLPPMNFE